MAWPSEPRPALILAAALCLPSCAGVVKTGPCDDAGTVHPVDAARVDDAGSDVFPDIAVPDVGVDANGGACVDDDQCEGAETCQSGVCCAGLFHEGVCFCGHGAGCDLFHVCCTTPASPDLPSCIENAISCCGAPYGAPCGP
jgi:hypothetical protein